MHVILHACSCLRQAIRLEAMSISPDAPSISMECKAEVSTAARAH